MLANKNILMIKSFLGVMRGNDKEIDIILPKMYVKDVYNINYDFLKHRNLTNLIFDIDNTILPVGGMNVPDELISLFKKLRKDFNICLVSNNTKERVIPIADSLEIECMYLANKPKEETFDRTLEILCSNKKNTVMVGDQMLSDIKGANMYGIYTIMVDPVSNKHNIKTLVARILQKLMIKKIKKKGVFVEKKYYEKEM